MWPHCWLKLLGSILLMASSFAGRSVQGQALCGPGFGTTGLELCVTVESSPPTRVDVFTGASPLSILTTVGDYSVDLTATLVANGTGIEVSVAGTLNKTGSSPASTVVVTAEGGRTAALPAGEGRLNLSGTATGASEIQLGGAAGFEAGTDLMLTGFPVTCDEVVFDGGAFECKKGAGPVRAGSVAVRSTTVVNIVNPFDIVDIPSGIGAGDPVLPPAADHVIALVLPGDDGINRHFSIEQFFRAAAPSECDGDEHFHARNGLAFPLEGGHPFVDDFLDCGAGKVNEALIWTLAVIDNPTTFPTGDQVIPKGAGILVRGDGSLTLPAGWRATVDDGAILDVYGTLHVDGALTIAPGGMLNNAPGGVIDNADMTIHNFGTINNRGTINNNGTIVNEPGGVVNDTGTLNGNPIVVPELSPTAAVLSALLALALLSRLRGSRLT